MRQVLPFSCNKAASVFNWPAGCRGDGIGSKGHLDRLPRIVDGHSKHIVRRAALDLR